MNIKKKIILTIWLILIGLLIYKPFSDYQFGILTEEYPDFLKDRPNYWGSNEYSSGDAPISLPDSDITFELDHLMMDWPFSYRNVEHSGFDGHLLTIFSSNSDQIQAVRVFNEVDGKELNEAFTTLFYLEKDYNAYPGGWRPVELSNGFTLEESHVDGQGYMYILAYDYPDALVPRTLFPEWSWFDEGTQTLEIDYINASGESTSVRYELNLHWYRTGGLWETAMSV